jgi:hypothetical protein
VRGFDDPEREYDKLVTHETIRELPGGLAGARLAHVPRYVEMLEYVYEQVGWDRKRIRGYRLDIQFPVYGAQYMMGFRIPERGPCENGLRPT